MPITIQRHTAQFATAPQLHPEHLAEVAALGFRSVINNRPDGEAGPAQPSHTAIAQAARAAGLHYAFLPVVTGQYSPDHIQTMANLMAGLPQPVLAFCRSGTRSTQLAALAQHATPQPLASA